jgi:ketosteroid isomerase-like protein
VITVARAMPQTRAPAATMTDHPNATRIRELFAAFREGDVAAIQATIPEDAVWHFPGRAGKLAGSHRGRAAIFQFLMNVAQLTGGTFHLDLEDVLANDRTAIALFRGHGERDGKTLDNPTCLRIRFENGALVEVWEFVWNLFEVDEFWS